ncbi:hypothetical protein BGX29_000770 [Mortierella sp. GBA35]|nr:hypothetical protein BGX23_001329 [Mortierella sp. AD031]KAF9105036.1 hypothetical protein BGX29_000770 [Mortierella sp. GBA35]KAG0214227.1 hypothetical protein BGX33_002304 [Mortierella sp. NVP41]
MKFSTASIVAAAIMAVATAAKPSTSDVVTISLPGTNTTVSATASPTSSGVGTATKTGTITVPIITTITVGVPTIITTTVTPSSTPTTPGKNSGNAIQAPVKAMVAIGGVAALAQFF